MEPRLSGRMTFIVKYSHGSRPIWWFKRYEFSHLTSLARQLYSVNLALEGEAGNQCIWRTLGGRGSCRLLPFNLSDFTLDTINVRFVDFPTGCRLSCSIFPLLALVRYPSHESELIHSFRPTLFYTMLNFEAGYLLEDHQRVHHRYRVIFFIRVHRLPY